MRFLSWAAVTAQTARAAMTSTRWQGRTYYLAHFNARRAIYSPHAPPAEPPAAGGCDGT
jgi:hypothetical protein